MLAAVVEDPTSASLYGPLVSDGDGSTETTGGLNLRPFSVDAVRALVLMNVQVSVGCVGACWTCSGPFSLLLLLQLQQAVHHPHA
jgi:hypothetical protein